MGAAGHGGEAAGGKGMSTRAASMIVSSSATSPMRSSLEELQEMQDESVIDTHTREEEGRSEHTRDHSEQKH